MDANLAWSPTHLVSSRACHASDVRRYGEDNRGVQLLHFVVTMDEEIGRLVRQVPRAKAALKRELFGSHVMTLVAFASNQCNSRNEYGQWMWVYVKEIENCDERM